MKKFDQFISNKEKMRYSIYLLENSINTNQLNLQGSGFVTQFNLQFDLGWKILKKLMSSMEQLPAARSGSPRLIIKEAYKIYPFLDENVWLAMLQDRNDMNHIYDESQLEEVVIRIITDYIPAFECMEKGLVEFYGDELKDVE